MKSVRTWTVRGVVRRFKKASFTEGFKIAPSVVIEINSIQAGNAKAYRYETAEPWIELKDLNNAWEKLSGVEFYLGEEVIVRITETYDEEGKRAFSLKEIEEKTMDILPASELLGKFI